AAVFGAAMRQDLSADRVLAELAPMLGTGLITAAVAKLGYEALDFLNLLERQHTALKRSALLLTRALAGIAIARFALGGLSGIALPISLVLERAEEGWIKPLVTIAAVFVLSIAGELLERMLFFMAAVAPRMPGGVKA